MILSYHPCFNGEENRICAGREPDSNDVNAIKAAAAVILPQGCSQLLYEMASRYCARVFPNYNSRFAYPGKTGQIRLFQQFSISHPPSAVYPHTNAYANRVEQPGLPATMVYPLVFKFDWGGEGNTVYLIENMKDLEEYIQKAAQYEQSGQKGFVLQQLIPTGGRVLRVVVIGTTVRTYWRVAGRSDQFYISISTGATIDRDKDPDLQESGVALVKKICDRTGINLAGFDVIFDASDPATGPFLLEINYFFGRRGLGGSSAYLELLEEQIDAWLRLQGIPK